MVDPNGLLMIEPSSRVSAEPVIDELTRKMTAAWRTRRFVDSTNGLHICACGARSDSNVWHVGPADGLLANWLCVHYLAYHRDEVPPAELDKVRALASGEAEPTVDEYCPRPRKILERLARVPDDLRDWLAGIPHGHSNWTALDAFVNTGSVWGINPARLPVAESELEAYLQRLAGVWPPSATGWSSSIKVVERIRKDTAERELGFQHWSMPRE